jgi:nitroreductase
MDGTASSQLRDVLTDCVRSATCAPSLHNSQPWLFRLQGRTVRLYADRGRRLDALDPHGRELVISLGAALFTLRLALQGAGYVPATEVLPDPADPDLIAVVTAGERSAPAPEVEALKAAIPRRHTNRWPFARSIVPAADVEKLVDAARREQAALSVAGAVARNAIINLSQSADRRLRAQGGYRAEFIRRTAPVTGRRDGIPPSAIGPWDALESLPLRDFGLLPPRLSRPAEDFEPNPTIMVLATPGDAPHDWVCAGQALQRTLLTATLLGLATTPISQPVEVPAIRELLTDTGQGVWAQMILRVGHSRPAPVAPRRPLDEVLLAESPPGGSDRSAR